MAEFTNYLSPEEIRAYQNQQSQINRSADIALRNLGYSRKYGEQDYQTSLANATYNWDKAFRSLPAAFARRGVLRSGIFGRGVGGYGYGREQAFNQLERGRERQAQGFEQQYEDIIGNRTYGLQGIEANRAARQSTLAALLRSMA